MKDFTIFGEEDGELKAYYASTNGKWRCVCCKKALTTDMVAALLAKHSANEDEYSDDKEVA
jgi:hypothetical protein